MQAKNLCFYLSDHGFGHIARNIPLIAEAVRRIDAYVYVVCGKRHLEFVRANLLEILTPEQSSRIRYRAEHTDIGLILPARHAAGRYGCTDRCLCTVSGRTARTGKAGG